jgi:hypothetical protein
MMSRKDALRVVRWFQREEGQKKQDGQSLICLDHAIQREATLGFDLRTAWDPFQRLIRWIKRAAGRPIRATFAVLLSKAATIGEGIPVAKRLRRSDIATFGP